MADPTTVIEWANVARMRHAHYVKLVAEYEAQAEPNVGLLPPVPVAIRVAERQLAQLVPYLLAGIDELRNCAECREYAGTGGENITCATCGKPGSDA